MSGSTVRALFVTGSLLSACGNVTTAVDHGTADEVVSSPSTGVRTGQSSNVEASGASDASAPSSNVIAPAPDLTGVCDTLTCASLEFDPNPVAESDDGRAKSLVIPADELADPGQGCSVWLDTADSGVLEQDISVRYLPPSDAGLHETTIPSLSPLACSAVPTREPGRDGGMGTRDGGVSTRDAGAPKDAGAGSYAGPSLGPAFALVDLGLEGWFLTKDAQGLWLELCANACFTVHHQGGLLLLDVPYAVVSPGAR